MFHHFAHASHNIPPEIRAPCPHTRQLTLHKNAGNIITKTRHPVGPYSMTMPGPLWWSLGGAFFYDRGTPENNICLGPTWWFPILGSATYGKLRGWQSEQQRNGSPEGRNGTILKLGSIYKSCSVYSVVIFFQTSGFGHVQGYLT